MKKITEKYDVIIVGAGNGGLAAASITTQHGLKTLLCERHNIPGGAASSFKRGRFEFEPSLHEMCQVGSEEKPGLTRKLFKDMGSDIKFVYEDTCYRAISIDPEEPFDITLPCGIDAFCAAIEKQEPGTGEKVKTFLKYEEKAIIESEKMGAGKIHLKDLGEIFHTFRMVSHSADQVMDQIGIPKKVQHMISPYWSYVGEPTNTLSAFMLGMMDYCYIVDGAGLPQNFSHELSLSIENVIRKNGGQIFYNSPVTKILIKNMRAYGVVVNGKKYYADNIICNCFPEDVFGKMVRHHHIPLFEIQKSNARKPGLSFINVHLGLNRTIEQLGIKDYTTFIMEKVDTNEQYKLCQNLGGQGYIIANALNTVIPDCSPEGTTHMSITAAVYGEEWAKVKPEDYKKTKLQIAEHMIQTYEKATGIDIHNYIEEIEVATPVTYSRYLGTPNGTPYGYQRRNWDGIFLRTMYGKKEETIRHLYFVGAHTEDSVGYNQTYKSGRRIANRIIKRKK